MSASRFEGVLGGKFMNEKERTFRDFLQISKATNNCPRFFKNNVEIAKLEQERRIRGGLHRKSTVMKMKKKNSPINMDFLAKLTVLQKIANN